MKTIAFAALALCACGHVADVGGAGGDCGAADVAISSSIGDATGGAEPCKIPEPPRALFRVNARDSRALDPWTLVFAVAPEPQAFWLPSATDNAGAAIVVKEATGAARRITVLTTGKDLFQGDGSSERETTDAWSSRTFIAWEDSGGASGWVLLDE